MKQETIEQAARSNALDDISLVGFDEHAIAMKYFAQGARWRISSAWHDTNKRPKTYRYIIVEKIIIDDKKDYEIWKQKKHDNWEHDVDYFGVVRWAYVADLLPGGKEAEQ